MIISLCSCMLHIWRGSYLRSTLRAMPNERLLDVLGKL